MHMYPKCDPNYTTCFKSYEQFYQLLTDGQTRLVIIVQTQGSCNQPNNFVFQGQYIQLTLSNAELPSVIIVKPEQETESYRVRCSKVPEEGITVTVVQEFNPM